MTNKNLTFIFRVIDTETKDVVIGEQAVKMTFSADDIAQAIESVKLREELGITDTSGPSVVQDNMEWLTKYAEYRGCERAVIEICTATCTIVRKFISAALIKLWAAK